jgi:hypothetical protein
LKGNADVQAAWASAFVAIKVNFSPENRNSAFLGRYPAIPGYPHIFVLEKTGALLHSQNTAELEQGSSYSKAAMTQFVEKWRSRESALVPPSR